VDHGQHVASCDTSLVVSGGVDCGRRRRNAYDKKPQCYGKDNRTAHLTAHSDKSVAYVTIKNSMFCTVGANYWQTRSIVRPLCDSRATFKKGSKSSPSNYRPISLTVNLCTGKVLESLMRDEMIDHLEKRALINNAQHGFIKNKSCLTNLGYISR